MDGSQKLVAVFWVCVAFTATAIASSVAYYQTQVDTVAIKAGLVQQRNGAFVLWVNPQNDNYGLVEHNVTIIQRIQLVIYAAIFSFD